MKYTLRALFVFTLIGCFWNAQASAAVLFWGLDADTDWNNADNWTPDGVALGPVPGAADHAIIHEGIIPPVAQPLITGAAAPGVNILTPSWLDGHTTSIDIGPGGSINVGGNVGQTSFTRLSGGNNTSSTVNFLAGAGISVWSILQMSFNNEVQGLPLAGTEGDSFINLDGGILHLGSLGFSNNGLNTTNIDIGGAAQLLVNGDHTDAGNGNATIWINSGYLTAVDGMGTVGVTFDLDNGRTVFTVQTIDLSADFDNDGIDVDGDDLALWQSDYANNDFSDADGDFDSDGTDYLIWQQTYTGPLSSLSVVPEPASFLLLGLGGCMVLSLRKRNFARIA